MDHVNIYIVTTVRAFDRDGAYVFIMECFRDGEAVTREVHGMLHDTTRNRAALQVLLMAVAMLKGRWSCPYSRTTHTLPCPTPRGSGRKPDGRAWAVSR